MANICSFTLKATGFKSEEDKKTFIASFPGSPEKQDVRVLCMYSDGIDVEEESKEVLKIHGTCPWSVENAMTNQIHRHKNEITLEELSEKFGLFIEVYSCEDTFQEHIVVENGNITEIKTVDWADAYIYDYPTYQDFERSLDFVEEITEEAFNKAKEKGEEYAQVGGFGDWNWSDRLSA